MDQQYWIGRWERGETGWHQAEFEPALLAQFSKLSPARVFVPFCGKSRDLKWLMSQGHEVMGVELSEKACRAFFEENEIGFHESKQGPFQVFRGGRVTFFCGDFFEFRGAELGEVGAVYDRAALIALPRELRVQYATHMKQLLAQSSRKEGFEFLQIVLERTPSDSNGPPFSVSAEELSSLYGDEFKIRTISREETEMREATSGKMEECVYRFFR